MVDVQGWPRRIAATVLVLVLASFFAISCGGTEPAKKSSSLSGSKPPEKPKGALALTEVAETDDHVEVQLTEITRGTSTDTAVPDNTPIVKFRVGVFNGGSENLDLALLTAGCMAGKPGEPAEEVFDAAQGLNGSPTTTLL